MCAVRKRTTYLKRECFKERPLGSSALVGGVDLDKVLRAGAQAPDVERRLVRRDVQHHGARCSVEDLNSEQRWRINSNLATGSMTARQK